MLRKVDQITSTFLKIFTMHPEQGSEHHAHGVETREEKKDGYQRTENKKR